MRQHELMTYLKMYFPDYSDMENKLVSHFKAETLPVDKKGKYRN